VAVIRLATTRLGGAVLVMACVATLAFLALHAAPGGPFDAERRLAPEVRRNVERAYHLDWPVWRQYAGYMADLARGDLGRSIKRPESVGTIIGDALPRSLELGLEALALAVAGGLALGLFAAARAGRASDRAAMALATLGVSVPAFVVGPLLIDACALRLGWLPAARWDDAASRILPAVTLALVYLGSIARLTRAGMLEVAGQDFVRTARAKGLAPAAVLRKHALRLGIVPVVTYLGPAAAALVAGSIVVESIFQIPGLGAAFVRSVGDRDYPVLTGIAVFYSALVVAFNLLADVAHGLLDPRVRE
jgi:oligopeptide transport system permease protein